MESACYVVREEARAAGVEVVKHERNQGKGAAIKTGLRELTSRAGVDWVLILDGDGQHLPEEIPHFFEEANRNGAEMVVGLGTVWSPLANWKITGLAEFPGKGCLRMYGA